MVVTLLDSHLHPHPWDCPKMASAPWIFRCYGSVLLRPLMDSAVKYMQRNTSFDGDIVTFVWAHQ